jgi:enoyl-CoA hydratase
MTGEIRLETAGPVGWVWFDNAARRNALTASMMEQLVAVMEKVSADDSIRVVVLRGAGELAFVSGADISAFGSASGVDRGPRVEEVTAAITDLGKPVIAALKGWCLGAGVLLALSTDLRVAADDLRIGIPAAGLGVAYPRQGVQRLVLVAGPAVASEMLLTGEPLDPAGALRTGLVNRVVPAASVFEEAGKMAAGLAANAPLTLQASKLTIASVHDPSKVEAADRAIAACFRSEDFHEGQRAFAEKRRPEFKGQ